MTASKGWRPLQRATYIHPVTEAEIAEAMRLTGADRATATRQLEDEVCGVEYWLNDLYQVAKRQLHGDDGEPIAMVHLNIRRRDGRPIFRDWRHFQAIKNQLIGEECEAVELYPAESRLNDTSNKYHLWCFTNPDYRVPFGMERRDVVASDTTRKPGYRQRRIA